MGGRGNQMFQYAVGRSLSLKYNTELKLDLNFLLNRTLRKNFVFRNFDLDLYNIKAEIASENESLPYTYYHSRVIRKLVGLKTKYFNGKYDVVEEEYFHFNPKVKESRDNSFLIGYWQSYKYFEDIKDIIKKDFTFKSSISEKAKEMMKEITDSNAICVNIRRADYISNPDANKHHGVCNSEYFERAAKLIEEKVDNPKYFVFSDDVEWCKENIKFSNNMVYVDHTYTGDRFSDYLRLMINCKHFIIPNSTFAWWAAWLNDNDNKIVVTPKQWFANQDINTNDLILDNWIKI